MRNAATRIPVTLGEAALLFWIAWGAGALAMAKTYRRAGSATLATGLTLVGLAAIGAAMML